MMLSKMHYAVELGKMGHRVYFVNPPRKTNTLLVSKGEIVNGVQLLDIKPLASALFLRHKLLRVYNWLMSRYARKIRQVAGGEIDELWNFNPNSFSGMGAFAAKKNIVLLYDFYRGKHVEWAVKNADIVLAPSRVILDHYSRFNKAAYFLQHGLGAQFVNHSQVRLRALATGISDTKVTKAGYTGNLLREAMNIALMEKIIRSHPGIEFNFWGPYSLSENNVTDHTATISKEWQLFIRFLKDAPNVVLHGVKEQEALSEAMQDMDVFLFVYSANTDMNAASNSHKLLEYISTGKAVISNMVSTYKEKGLLEMCMHEEDFPALFDHVINNIEQYNAVEKQQERIEYALNNSYVEQIGKIQHYLYLK
jgi:glycosyltransferase involved in cell wall biosynthesis